MTLRGRRLFVNFPRHHWLVREVLGWGVATSCSTRAQSPHGIVAGDLAVLHRPTRVEERQREADREHRGAGRRQDVEHLELVRVCVIATRHAEVTGNELREERQVEPTNKMRPAATIDPRSRYTAGQSSSATSNGYRQEAHDGAADHDVVEVRHHEVVSVVDVEAHRGEEQTRETADGEQADEAEPRESSGFPGTEPF